MGRNRFANLDSAFQAWFRRMKLLLSYGDAAGVSFADYTPGRRGLEKEQNAVFDLRGSGKG